MQQNHQTDRRNSMPELFTVADLMKRTGITRPSLIHRVKMLKEQGCEARVGEIIKLSSGYLFTREQAELICFGTGRKSNSKEYWHRLRAASSRNKRRKAS